MFINIYLVLGWAMDAVLRLPVLITPLRPSRSGGHLLACCWRFVAFHDATLGAKAVMTQSLNANTLINAKLRAFAGELFLFRQQWISDAPSY